jgi:hypothetical protein
MARLLDWAQTQGLPELGLEWVDPYQGAGGFGASTAQFALAYFAFMQASAERAETAGDWKSAWDLYRSLMGSDVLVPSGADLVAQWQGGVVEFDPRLFRAGVDPGAQPVVEDLWQCFDWSQLLVFRLLISRVVRLLRMII